MSDLGRRVERVSATLTAKERAILIWRACKEGRKPDAAWRRTMPADQADEVDRYLALVDCLDLRLGAYLSALRGEVEQLSLRLESLCTLLLWGHSAWKARFSLMRDRREPVTESEYRELERRARAELVPVAELAEELVEEPGAPEKADPAVREVWEQRRGEKETVLTALVEQCVLVGEAQEQGLVVQAGSFSDWLGETVPMRSAWGLEYEVLPDEAWEQVRRRREERTALQGPGELAPMLQTARIVGWPEEIAELAEWAPQDDLLEEQHGLVRAGVTCYGGEFAAIELVVEEIRNDLDGEDPLLPEVRQTLEESRDRLSDIHEQAEQILGRLELKEPDEAEVAQLRGFLTAAE